MPAQAIAGVSATHESRIMTEYPSVGATSPGRLIGQIMDCIPVRIFGIKISSLLFGLPCAPIGLLIFLLNKLGARYVLTNRSIQIWTTMGSQRVSSVDLGEVDSVDLEELPGQSFYRSADLRVKSAKGQTLLRLSGVADAAAFRNAILRAVESRRLVQASLATINARKS